MGVVQLRLTTVWRILTRFEEQIAVFNNLVTLIKILVGMVRSSLPFARGCGMATSRPPGGVYQPACDCSIVFSLPAHVIRSYASSPQLHSNACHPCNENIRKDTLRFRKARLLTTAVLLLIRLA